MPDYKAMYFRLFNRVSDAIELLKQAQQEGEESFVSDADKPPIDLLRNEGNTEKIPPD